jgi:uncharacterized protein YndB with AHSA1/START domain
MNAALAPAAVVVRRTISASREELFDAWLNPYALAVWMRPGEIRDTRAEVDARVGGAYEIVMRGDSNPIIHRGVYLVIDRPDKLVFTWVSQFTGQDETLVTVDFLPVKDRTEVVVTHEKLPEDQRPGHSRGWTSGLEHLDQACQQRQLPGQVAP